MQCNILAGVTYFRATLGGCAMTEKPAAPQSRTRLRRLREMPRRDALLIGIPALLLLVAGFALAARYIKPAPPDTLVISSAGEGSAYQVYATRYKAYLERFGIHVKVLPSRGSPENIARLRADPPEADAALVQGGTSTPEDAELRSLGAVYYEPLWVFHRGKKELDRIDQLVGKRVAVGTPGSGTHHLAQELLEAHGLSGAGLTQVEIGGLEVVDALLEGKVDAAFVVGAPQSATVWALLYTPGISLMDFSQSDAYARRFPHLYRLTLPHGAVDLQRDIPSRDIHLVAPLASLAVHQDTHPAHIDLLLQAMRQVHRNATLFEDPGEFPMAQGAEFPLHDRAARFYQSGPPLLQRYLPFGVANLIDRMVVLLVPLLALALPLSRILPPLYTWRVRARLYRWYGELKYLETEADLHPEMRTPAEWFAALDRIEEAVNSVHVPLAFADYLYQLRAHIALVRAGFSKRFGEKPAEGEVSLRV